MENTAYPCPRCGAPADLTRGCSGCGLSPYPPAAEVVRLDREIVALGREVERARGAYQEVSSRLLAAQRRRAELAARVRTEVPPVLAGRPPSGPVPPVPVASGPRPVPAVPGRPETSTRTVQGLLFVLGGLLLGTAAVVFTAVAWAAVGVAGRALILAAFTALALAVPLLAARRGLRGTAETFAAVGLLLVVLDGYAAWAADLLGTADWPGTRYAALVGGVSAAVAAGYARLTRLAVPWFAALLVAQPVLPLAAVEARPGAGGWTLVLLGVALLDLGVVVALRGRSAAAPVPAGSGPAGSGPVGPASAGPAPVVTAGPAPAVPAATGPVPAGPVPVGAVGGSAAAGGGPVADPRVPSVVDAGRVLAWLGFGVASTLAAGCALVPLAWGRAAGQPVLAGLPMLLVGLVLLGAALAAGGRAFRQVAAGLLVPVLAAALLRPVAELRAGFLLLTAGVVGAGLAGAVRLLPARFRPGPRVGALVVVGGLVQLGALATVLLAGGAVARSLPPWHGAPAGPQLPWGWQLPIAVALTVGAVALLLPRAARPVTALAGVALTASALPAVPAATPWRAALAVDLLVGAALLLVAVRPGRRTPTVLAGSLAAAALLGHGLLVGLAAPGGTLAALGVVLAVGLAAPVLASRDAAAPQRVAGIALVAALLAVPAGVTVALHAAGAPGWWQLRGGFAAAALVLGALLAVRRLRPDLDGYASTALALSLAVLGPAALVVPGGEPVALYAALAALLLAVADRGAVLGRLVGGGSTALAVLAAAPVTVRALTSPYGGPVRPWSGAPAPVAVPGAPAVAAALLVLAVAAALVARRAAGGRAIPGLAALPFGAAALPVLLVTARTPWPTVPAAVLLTGVAALLVAALAEPVGPQAPPGLVTVPVGLVWTGCGLVGLLATRAGTLAGLALLVVAAAVTGAAARRAEVRLLGWLAAVTAATCFAVTAPLAAGLPVRTAGFAVLAVAVVVLFAAPLLGRRGPGHPAELRLGRRALEAAAQAVALVALLLTTAAPRHAAAVCVLWGAAVALRVLRRGESTAGRWALAGIAGGSELLGAWLLLAAGGVVLLEAYTLPAAGLALAAGLVALRSRPGLTSWLALGPGLAAGLLPSLASVLGAPEPQPWRRLLLGAAALGVVLAGATRRWQAPVLLGGATLVLLALYELARGWDLLPRWIYLAVGGLALIALAATYERRRRDLTRLRAAVGSMS
ncbi:SCO7613 C-terminal domain-containing membrane protein [Micromonospora sp. DT47]|uniref:SCO7613 C-terminal domain-containing membrane protein n=1 Tax=Micromonospora sp. DT47 TaxID=3393431 RepID=UPI003CEC45B4